LRILSQAALVAAALAIAGCGGGSGGAERIVLVTIDTLRADHVGAYGDLGARTPVLDELAARGVRFEHAIAPTPLTLPSHTSLMTGLQPPHHGVRHNSVFALDEEIPVLAERMREAGYATGAFVGAFVLDARFGLARGFDVYDDELSQRRASKSPFSFAERRADAVVDAALDWLSTASDRFFLWVHLYDPHADYDPPAPYRRHASGDAYAGEIAFADAQMGRLVRFIGNRWGADGLVVVVTSDHGESLGEHREATHSYTVYDATQRVPLILMGPNLPRGAVVPEPVRLTDVAPTLLWLAGIETLSKSPEGYGGRNLVPLMHGGEEASRVAYVETLATQLDMGWSPLLGVRTMSHKYIRAPQPELYDLEEDPDETRNLALEQPKRAAELDALLEVQLQGARAIAPSVELEAGDRARLESLGYVVPRTGSVFGDLGVVGGLNPRDHMLEASRVQEARSALGDGQPLRALELLEPVQGPGRIVAQTRAQAALSANRPELAVAAMEELRERGEASPSDLTVLGMAYLSSGRHEDARETFEAARSLDPETHGPWSGLGLVALREDDLEAAERWFREAEARAPQPEAVRVDLAVLRLHQGRPTEADALLEGVDDGFLAEPSRALLLARAEGEAGRLERGLALLRRALRDRPKHVALLQTYANLLESAGELDRALEVRERLHAAAPQDPGSKNDLAWGLAMAGRDLDRALLLARDAAAALDGDPAVLDTLATVHLARSEPTKALAVADQALGVGDEAEAVRAHLLWVRGAALADLGREDDARDALRALRGEEGELASPWKERMVQLERRLGMATPAPPAESSSGTSGPPRGTGQASER